MSQTQEQEKTGLVAVIFNVGSRVTSTSWHSARTWRMRAEEIRALADEMREPEPESNHAEDCGGLWETCRMG